MDLKCLVHRYTLIASFILFFPVAFPSNGWCHEVVGEVTPLMVHTKNTLTLIDNGRNEQALTIAWKIYEDFQSPMRQGTEAGLKTSSARIDKTFGTKLKSSLNSSIKRKNYQELQKELRLLSFFLMLEKFNVLEKTFGKKSDNLSAQKTIFWLGRNYFSYLLEPTMGKLDPIGEKRLVRPLDKMLYSIEDGERNTFKSLRKELENGTIHFFKFPVFEHTFN